ncbi:hypothetical protein L210DRAFT_953612 [Boletus edulis BED1]|uniref:Uncharacterized protein n=1 Tax=Boletus edulis BED1 TaxID=1328754 RepID=A0AAD4G7R3_BOLED|nr:hypothetical protein L210DRAFT_953612 [Boletus edulis BED1]
MIESLIKTPFSVPDSTASPPLSCTDLKDSVADRPRRRRGVPYVHTLHGEDECLSTALSSHSTTLAWMVVPGATASGPPASLSRV